MRCQKCNLHPADGASLIRMNATGQKGVWECAPGTGCNRIVGEPEPTANEKLLDAISGKGAKWN